MDLMALDRNTPTEWSMTRSCDDGGVMVVAQWWWRYCLRPSGYMAREQIISYYCATAHTLLKPELRSYRLQTTWVRNVRARAGLHWGQWLVIMRRTLMATPDHYCSLTSSDKVNEESISGRMMGGTKNGRATSFERWGFYGPQHRHSHARFQQWPCQRCHVPNCIILRVVWDT